MKTFTHRLRRAAGAVGVASAMSLLMSGSAHAAWEHPSYTYCDFGQYGYASWYQPYDIDTIANMWGLWRDHNNKLVKGPTTSFAWDGPGYAHLSGQGDDRWALYGLILEAGDYVTERAKGCKSTADLAFQVMRDLPLREIPGVGDTEVGLGAVPPPLAVGFTGGPVPLP